MAHLGKLSKIEDVDKEIARLSQVEGVGRDAYLIAEFYAHLLGNNVPKDAALALSVEYLRRMKIEGGDK
jgi:hypothetical protein